MGTVGRRAASVKSRQFRHSHCVTRHFTVRSREGNGINSPDAIEYGNPLTPPRPLYVGGSSSPPLPPFDHLSIGFIPMEGEHCKYIPSLDKSQPSGRPPDDRSCCPATTGHLPSSPVQVVAPPRPLGPWVAFQGGPDGRLLFHQADRQADVDVRVGWLGWRSDFRGRQLAGQ